MHNLDTGSFPNFDGFQQACAYVQRTLPMKSGPNKGIVPLRFGRRDSDKYNIDIETGTHSEDPNNVQRVVRAYHYGTPIVEFFEDGAIRINSCPSMTTNKLQGQLLPRRLIVSSVGGHKCLTIDHVDTDAVDMCEYLFAVDHKRMRGVFGSRFRAGSTRLQYPFVGNNDMLLLPKNRNNDVEDFLSDGSPWRVVGHGYYVSPQRAYHDKLVGKFMRDVFKQLRAVYRMAGREHESDTKKKLMADVYEGEMLCNEPYMAVQGLVDAHDMIHSLIAKEGWTPGKPISYDTVNALMSTADFFGQSSYRDRLHQWAALRLAPRRVSDRTFGDTQGWAVFSEEEFVELCDWIEERTGEPPV